MKKNTEWSWVKSEWTGLVYRVLFGGVVLWALIRLDIVIPFVKLALTPTIPE